MLNTPVGKVKKGTKERGLLNRALARLEETAGVKTRGIHWEPLHPQGRGDARVEFAPPLKAHWIEMKGELTPARLGPVLETMRHLPRPNLLVAPYVAQPMAIRLRQEGVQFVDGEGNAYLDQPAPRLLVWVTGNRPARPKAGERPLRVFRAAGLRVIFPVLCLPEPVTATYRDLARWAGVALGTVAKTVEELEHLGYLRKTKTNLALENKVHLLDAWADAYPRELRPLLEPRRFRTDKAEWWRRADWPLLGAWLGGEPAAALMTKHLHPAGATVYSAGGITELAKTLRLAKDEQGNVEVLQKFWFFDQEMGHGPRLVPPLLAYADLLTTGDARNLETAAIIKERFLA
jgi:hypothetical protein